MLEVNRLRSVANELNRLQTTAQNALRNMGGFWEGAAANAFSTRNEQWRRELRAIEQEITGLAALIQRIADEIRDAEQRAQAAITSF
jgi:WXG100 family type VII secretion target